MIRSKILAPAAIALMQICNSLAHGEEPPKDVSIPAATTGQPSTICIRGVRTQEDIPLTIKKPYDASQVECVWIPIDHKDMAEVQFGTSGFYVFRGTDFLVRTFTGYQMQFANDVQYIDLDTLIVSNKFDRPPRGRYDMDRFKIFGSSVKEQQGKLPVYHFNKANIRFEQGFNRSYSRAGLAAQAAAAISPTRMIGRQYLTTLQEYCDLDLTCQENTIRIGDKVFTMTPNQMKVMQEVSIFFVPDYVIAFTPDGGFIVDDEKLEIAKKLGHPQSWKSLAQLTPFMAKGYPVDPFNLRYGALVKDKWPNEEGYEIDYGVSLMILNESERRGCFSALDAALRSMDEELKKRGAEHLRKYGCLELIAPDKEIMDKWKEEYRKSLSNEERKKEFSTLERMLECYQKQSLGMSIMPVPPMSIMPVPPAEASEQTIFLPFSESFKMPDKWLFGTMPHMPYSRGYHPPPGSQRPQYRGAPENGGGPTGTGTLGPFYISN